MFLGEVEIGVLEREAHLADEGEGVRMWAALRQKSAVTPNVTEARAECLEALDVQAAVRLLVGQDAEAAAAECPRHLREREEGPREQLGGLQLVVGQRVQDADPLGRVRHARSGGTLIFGTGSCRSSGGRMGPLTKRGAPGSSSSDPSAEA